MILDMNVDEREVDEMLLTIERTSVNAAYDALNDALHEAADDAGVPDGEIRDEWRRARMEDFGIEGGEEMIARALVSLGVEPARVEENYGFISPSF